LQAQQIAVTPMKRVGRSEDSALEVLFLASDDSGCVTGVELTLDGGLAQL
jgi:NAD(P)-dependent dehydrogenase (short-subunit alcohol dehydrogenase family)